MKRINKLMVSGIIVGTIFTGGLVYANAPTNKDKALGLISQINNIIQTNKESTTNNNFEKIAIVKEAYSLFDIYLDDEQASNKDAATLYSELNMAKQELINNTQIGSQETGEKAVISMIAPSLGLDSTASLNDCINAIDELKNNNENLKNEINQSADNVYTEQDMEEIVTELEKVIENNN